MKYAFKKYTLKAFPVILFAANSFLCVTTPKQQQQQQKKHTHTHSPAWKVSKERKTGLLRFT